MCASPQKENGFIPIANAIAEALGRINLSAYESRILWIIFRKTYGWNKKEDKIALSQFKTETNISIPHICRTLKKLVAKGIITQIGNGYYVRYSFQKNYEQWKSLPKQAILPKLLPKQAITTAYLGNKLLPKQADTKDIKDTIQKTNTAMSYFYSSYKQVFGKDYIASFGKDGKIFKELSHLIPNEELKALIDEFFKSEDEFIKKAGYTIGIFKSQLNKLRNLTLNKRFTPKNNEIKPINEEEHKKVSALIHKTVLEMGK